MTPTEHRELIAGIRANAAYNAADRGKRSYGELTCVCPEPQADPSVNFGECARCRRKPLALFGAAS